VKSQQPSDDQARVYADGLRRVALASVAALAVVLPLAVTTAEHHDGHLGNAGHSAGHGGVGRAAGSGEAGDSATDD
jgi:hypothetical protein